jgi:hypothetical protein
MGLGVDPNDRSYLEVEVPAGDGVGTARAIARAYSAFAEGGAGLPITPETFARLTAPPVVAGTMNTSSPCVTLEARSSAGSLDECRAQRRLHGRALGHEVPDARGHQQRRLMRALPQVGVRHLQDIRALLWRKLLDDAQDERRPILGLERVQRLAEPLGEIGPPGDRIHPREAPFCRRVSVMVEAGSGSPTGRRTGRAHLAEPRERMADEKAADEGPE